MSAQFDASMTILKGFVFPNAANSISHNAAKMGSYSRCSASRGVSSDRSRRSRSSRSRSICRLVSISSRSNRSRRTFSRFLASSIWDWRSCSGSTRFRFASRGVSGLGVVLGVVFAGVVVPGLRSGTVAFVDESGFSINAKPFFPIFVHLALSLAPFSFSLNCFAIPSNLFFLTLASSNGGSIPAIGGAAPGAPPPTVLPAPPAPVT
mmetsp:Transcript_5082/g.11214  ORF Transcript_5082/g.11214 Transcript_5082/m.11214 type:complete len:207 (-) Transcript_5082:766-1386(-)